MIDGNLYENYPKENRHLVIALNMAAIVAYARPFLDSRGKLAHNRLPGKVLKILSEDERAVHETVLEDRNTMMAHSDADANVSIPLVLETKTRNILVPKNASPYATPLLPAAMQILCNMSYKFQEYCFKLRQEMEPDMLPILPRVETDSSNGA
jgi:hypothetical protein